jgi:hypothetical protein
MDTPLKELSNSRFKPYDCRDIFLTEGLMLFNDTLIWLGIQPSHDMMQDGILMHILIQRCDIFFPIVIPEYDHHNGRPFRLQIYGTLGTSKKSFDITLSFDLLLNYGEFIEDLFQRPDVLHVWQPLYDNLTEMGYHRPEQFIMFLIPMTEFTSGFEMMPKILLDPVGGHLP